MQLRFAIDTGADGRAGGASTHLLVRCQPGTTWADVSAAAEVSTSRVAYVDGLPLGPDSLVGHPPLVHGASIVLRPGNDTGIRRLAVQIASGPAAGVEFPLRSPRALVGRGAESDLVLADPHASRRHLELVVDEKTGAVSAGDLGSTNGTAVDQKRLGTALQPVAVGSVIHVGRTTLRLVDGRRRGAVGNAWSDGSGHMIINVPPRFTSPYQPPEIAPTDALVPDTGRRSRVHLVVPVILASLLALTYGSGLLITSLAVPIVGIASALMMSFRHARTRHAVASYAGANQAAAIRHAVAADLSRRRDQAPDAAELLSMAKRSTPGLWQRQPGDADFGLIRIGIGDIRSSVVVRARDGRAHRSIVRDAPVTLSITDHPVVGIAGPRAKRTGLARFVVAQLAILHSPQHVKLVAQRADTVEPLEDEWTWMRWLPHSTTGGPGIAVLSNPASWQASDPPSAICLAESIAALPQRCTAVIEFTDGGAARLTTDAGIVEGIVPDLVTCGWADQCARALAPLRIATPARSEPPDLVWLADLLELDPRDPGQIRRRWERTEHAPRAVLGMTAAGPFVIDLRHDGPHLLVGGMTGSGKSELLRTLVATLALNCRPDELSVLLVDYKGGAAFGECTRLPHTVGLVTDLDNALTARALSGLNAELRRRERLFAKEAVSDIAEYEMLAKRAGLPPCPRLVIVVDEFATLVEELPEFIAGLVSVARRGRSLGFHMVLATQRPAGAVSGDIRANVALRIALGVADDGDSIDLIGVPDAAAIRVPGRALAQSVEGTPTCLQVARIGGLMPSEGVCTRTVPATAWDEAASIDGSALDLGVIAEGLRAASADMGMLLPTPPWAEPLPSLVRCDDLPIPNGSTVVIGLIDRPDEQRHAGLEIDLSSGEHWLVAGGAGSGKTTLARTFVSQVARSFSPADAHLYVIDSAGELTPLASLPHCGAVVTANDSHRVTRLLDRLVQELDRRRTVRIRRPSIILIVDGWSAFTEAVECIEHGRPLRTLRQILRFGPAAGVTVLLTGDRDLLTSRISAHTAHRIVLRLPDSTDYVAAGLMPKSAPENPPPGRGVLAPSGNAAQIAVASERPRDWSETWPKHPGGAEYADEPQSTRWGGEEKLIPIRIERLPDRVTADDARFQVRTDEWKRLLWVPLGLGGDDLQPVGLELSGRVLVVAGPARSGRTTTLETIRCWTRRAGLTVLDVQPDTDLDPDIASDHSLILVDDAERVLHKAIDGALVTVAGSARTCGIVVAGRTETFARVYSGIAAVGRRGGAFLLLGPPTPDDVELVGMRILKEETPPPGRGVLVLDGTQTGIQVLLPDGQAP